MAGVHVASSAGTRGILTGILYRYSKGCCEVINGVQGGTQGGYQWGNLVALWGPPGALLAGSALPTVLRWLRALLHASLPCRSCRRINLREELEGPVTAALVPSGTKGAQPGRNLRRDWAHPWPICAGTGLTPAAICRKPDRHCTHLIPRCSAVAASCVSVRVWV
jgi:hypothetical protein